MPNGALLHLDALTPRQINDTTVKVIRVDEYVQPNLDYLRLLTPEPGETTLVAFVSTQSHQFPYAADLAAKAMANGCLTVIGGPHAMTCDTSMIERNNGQLAIAQAEAEKIWPQILADASRGELRPRYGEDGRWMETLPRMVQPPPTRGELRKSVLPLAGYYFMRGCPKPCTFCAVGEIAGKRERGQSLDAVLETLILAKRAGVNKFFLTSDNFNHWSLAKPLMRALIDTKLGLRFMCQCTTALWKDEEFFDLAGRSGCSSIFFGVESVDPDVLKDQGKQQNNPDHYPELVKQCAKQRIASHFSNMIGFPTQTPEKIREQLMAICAMAPDLTSWYIMTHLPGTKDYQRAKGRFGLHPDLSMYDCNRPAWEHPLIPAPLLQEMLFDCYRGFYNFDKAWQRLKNRNIPMKTLAARMLLGSFNLYCVQRRIHPMSGGVWPVYMDCENDYREIRRKTFEFDLYPLPDRRELSPADQAMNRLVNPALIAKKRAADAALPT